MLNTQISHAEAMPSAQPRPHPLRPAPTMDHPRILVVGESGRSEAVARTLKRLDAEVARVQRVSEAKDAIVTRRSVVVLVSPLPHSSLREAARSLLDDDERRPHSVFAVVTDEFSDRRARRLYEAGMTAVFEWPYEAVVLPSVLLELLGASPKYGRAPADTALERAVGARLELMDDAAQVDVSVTRGAVTLQGSAETFWARQRIVGAVAHVPGVISIHADRLEVVPTERADADIGRDVRQILLSVAGLDARTISVASRDGHITLAGVVGRHAERQRLETVVGNVTGIRGLTSHVTVAPMASLVSRSLASKLRRQVSTSFATADVNVTAFDHVAVLDGHAETLSQKQAVEAFVLDTPGIGRVVNKLRVRGEYLDNES